MSRQESGSEGVGSPISNDAYNVLAALHSKLEGMEAYRKYATDQQPDLWRQLTDLDRQAVELLVDQLETLVDEGRLRPGAPGSSEAPRPSRGGGQARSGGRSRTSGGGGGGRQRRGGGGDGEGGDGDGGGGGGGRQRAGGGARVNPIQIQRFLGGLDYPVGKEDLVKRAQERGADENVISTLEALPDEQFQTPAEVSQAVGRVE